MQDANPATKVGQLIGNAFEAVVIDTIRQYLNVKHPGFELQKPDEGKKSVQLSMLGGLSRQMDNVIVAKSSEDPIALLETKWLKDARHHNDKGAWILQLREVRKNYATIRGSVAILAGYWTSGVGVMLMNEGGVRMILTATDEQVYSTLQPEVDAYLGENSFQLDPSQMRKRYIRPVDLRRVLCYLQARGKLQQIASNWLQFPLVAHADMIGLDVIYQTLDALLAPLPHNPQIEKFEISLQINTGNTVYEEFEDFEEMREFIERLYKNPNEILNRIKPRKYNDDNPD